MLGLFARLFGNGEPKKPVASFSGDPYPLIERRVQQRLKDLGYFEGEVDGIAGPSTQRAVIDFKRKHGLVPRFLIGPVTLQYLFGEAPKTPQNKPKPGDPPWIKIAKGYLGLKEIKGKVHNAEIVGWFSLIGAGWFTDDETPWCAAYFGAMLIKAGVMTKGKGTARARGYEGHSELIRLPGPIYGCGVTFWRGSPSSGNGHAAFVVGKDSLGRLVCHGGNQQDAVTEAPFDIDRVTGYWWPKGYPVPKGTDLPMIDTKGKSSSSNEA